MIGKRNGANACQHSQVQVRRLIARLTIRDH